MQKRTTVQLTRGRSMIYQDRSVHLSSTKHNASYNSNGQWYMLICSAMVKLLCQESLQQSVICMLHDRQLQNPTAAT
jgi:hypothetical protein